MKIQNLSQSFETMKLLLDIRKNANSKTLLGISLINAIDSKEKPADIIQFIKDQATDCRRVMEMAIGKELTIKTLSL